MTCDGCGMDAADGYSKKELVKWNLSFSWPPVQRQKVTEYWCWDCTNSLDGDSAGAASGGPGGL